MGGETGAISTPGHGSTFWFTARLKHATSNAVSVIPPLSSVVGRRILVVDDNLTNRKVLQGQLEQCGARPECVSNAKDALDALHQARLERRPFDVALLDHHMPECDGAELGQMILENEHLKSTPLVLLTSSGQRDAAQHFAQIGFAGYLLNSQWRYVIS